MRRWPQNAYTDAPLQHPNLLLGSLHLLFWWLVHPSAWRNHVARIDPSLAPDFALIDLAEAPWRNPRLRRLLVQLTLVLPLFSAAVVLATLTWAGQGGAQIASGVAFALVLGVAAGLPASVVGGVVVGSAVALFGGVAFGIALGLSSDVTVATSRGFAHGLASGVIGPEQYSSPPSLILLCGLAFAVAANLFAAGWERPARTTPSSLPRLAVGIVAGVVVGAVAVVVAYAVSFGIAAAVLGSTLNIVLAGALVGVIGSLAGSVAGLLRGGLWYRVRLYALPGVAAFGAIVGALFVWPIADAPPLLAGVLYGVTFAAIFSLVTAGVFGLPLMLAQRLAGPWAGAIAATLCTTTFWSNTGWSVEADPLVFVGLGAVSTMLGLTIHRWRPVLTYAPLVIYNMLLLRLEAGRSPRRPALLRYHAAFWDEHQRHPWPGLDEHVVLVATRDPEAGRAAIDYLAASRTQRWAAQAAQIELDARALEACATIGQVARAHATLAAGELRGPASALLRSFSRISEDAAAALAQSHAYTRRLALTAVEDRLDGLQRELTRSSEPYALRFQPIAAGWREIVAGHGRDLAAETERRQEIDNPYVIGVPLTAEQEIFVGRTDVSARIEQQLLDRRRPPLLLYGQRRMGKTSLLNNLGRLLPSTIVPLFVDLQGPASQAGSEAGLLYYLARSMAASAQRQRGITLPTLDRATIERDPFIVFDEWLTAVERCIGNGTALIMLDEFEVLDRAFQRGRFDEEAVLGLLRHIIQHRPRCKVLLAGSHGLSEFRRWSSYLINAQVVRIGFLSPEETRKLVEQPIKDFELRYAPEATARVLALTQGHPFLVQLLCAEIVAQKNEQDPDRRRLAELADVEAAVAPALDSGDMFFADIAHNQIGPEGLAALRLIAAAGEGAVLPHVELCRRLDDEAGIEQLLRRELIERRGDGYRIQVELIRRWFTR